MFSQFRRPLALMENFNVQIHYVSVKCSLLNPPVECSKLKPESWRFKNRFYGNSWKQPAKLEFYRLWKQQNNKDVN